MKNVLKGLLGWRLVCAALLLCLAPTAYAADDDKDAPPAAESGAGAPSEAKAPEPSATPEDADKDAGNKDDDKDAAKDDNRGPGRKGGVELKGLIEAGFLVRTTVFIPADAVTRQTGAVSGDAMVLTLQKETAIAICYYTFKAYVRGGKSLMKIDTCTVYD